MTCSQDSVGINRNPLCFTLIMEGKGKREKRKGGKEEGKEDGKEDGKGRRRKCDTYREMRGRKRW